MDKSAFDRAIRDITLHTNSVAKRASADRKLVAVPAEANDIVNMASLSGGLADTLGAGTFGSDRAGRSQSMAAASGREPSFGVKHPVLQSLGYSTLGSITGGLAGNTAGGLLGAGTGRMQATYAGATAGMFLGLLAAAASRRKDMRATNEAYNEARGSGTLQPKTPDMSVLAAALLPFRGPHRRGQMQGYYMASGEDEKPMHTSSQLKYIAEHLPYIGLPTSVIGGYGQNLATQLESRAARAQKTSQLHIAEQQIKTAYASRIIRSLFRARGKSPLPAVRQAAPSVQRAQPRLTDNRRQLAVSQQPTRYSMAGPDSRLIDVKARPTGAGGGSAAAGTAAGARNARGSALRQRMFRVGRGAYQAGRTTLYAAKKVVPYIGASMLMDRLTSGGSAVAPPAAADPMASAVIPAALPAATARPYGRVTSFEQLPADFQQRYRSRNASGLNIGYNDQAAVDAFNRLYAGTTRQLAGPGGAGQRAYASAALRRRGGLRGTPGTVGQVPNMSAVAASPS